MGVKKKVKKILLAKIIAALLPLLFFVIFVIVIIAMFIGGAASNVIANCGTDSKSYDGGSENNDSGYASIDAFVKEHKAAYILSWKAGGFLPSASITQTMVENGFNFTNPNGTSFWQAHNMGGVKTSRKSDFPITIQTYGEGSVDLTGTKPGTNVGDATGGAYAWFSSYAAGIVGKAEFMAHQTLYTGAINNTDGIATLKAIAAGGWASDPADYTNKLVSTYNSLGVHYKWLDQEAIAAHGEAPYKALTEPSQPQAENDGGSNSKSGPKSDLPQGVSADSWEMVLVNRENRKEEMDPNLASVEGIQVDTRIQRATENFLAKAREINPNFKLISGYRSVETQRSVYNAYVHKEMAERGISYEDAEKFVQVYSQPAGASEHMTGLAIDISPYYGLNQMSDAEDAALEKAGLEFGFIRHFKEEFKPSTGIGDEDWHYRYIGVESAKYIYEKKISFEDYIKLLEGHGPSLKGGNNECGSNSGSASDGTDEVPADAISWGYKPEDLPASLKPYIINPQDLGMAYGNSAGWYQPGSDLLAGQCVNLTVSLGNHIWGHSGGVPGNGKDQAAAWATIFGNTVKTNPKKGAIFSTQKGGGGYGHTGIVCHVFANGSILIVEQNTPLSGWDLFKKPYTWNYRIWTPEQQASEEISFAYPDGKEPKLKNSQ